MTWKKNPALRNSSSSSSKRTGEDVPARVDVRLNFNGGSTAVPRSFVDSADFGTGCFPLHFGIVAPGIGITSRIVSVRNEHATLGVVADIILQSLDNVWPKLLVAGCV